jgi:hypothetical protein
MSTSQEVLPYSVSTGSAFGAFEKLQGTKNYVTWEDNMQAVLLSLRQWGVVAGTVVRPTPVDPAHPTPDEIKAKDAWDVRGASAFMEISFRLADFAMHILGGKRNPKVVGDLLEKRFGAKQAGLQSSLIPKFQLALWDGTGTIHTHRDYMVNLRVQLADMILLLLH